MQHRWVTEQIRNNFCGNTITNSNQSDRLYPGSKSTVIYMEIGMTTKLNWTPKTTFFFLHLSQSAPEEGESRHELWRWLICLPTWQVSANGNFETFLQDVCQYLKTALKRVLTLSCGSVWGIWASKTCFGGAWTRNRRPADLIVWVSGFSLLDYRCNRNNRLVLASGLRGPVAR